MDEERWSTHAMFHQAPISINKAYTIFRGRTVLKSAGNKFKDGLAQAVSRSANPEEWKQAHDLIYQQGGRVSLLVVLFFADLRNMSWKPGKKTAGGKPQSPYKKKDASNYVKLIEDAVSKGSGIDDCNNLDVTISKRYDLANPRVEIVLTIYKESEDGEEGDSSAGAH